VKQTTAVGALIVLTALGVLVVAGCPKQQATTPPVAGPTGTEAPPAETAATQPPDNIGNAKNAEGKCICPVLGDPVTDFSAGNSVEYQGKAYFFCCPDCRPKFESDPAKYAKAAAAGEVPEGSAPAEATGEPTRAEGPGGTK